MCVPNSARVLAPWSRHSSTSSSSPWTYVRHRWSFFQAHGEITVVFCFLKVASDRLVRVTVRAGRVDSQAFLTVTGMLTLDVRVQGLRTWWVRILFSV